MAGKEAHDVERPYEFVSRSEMFCCAAFLTKVPDISPTDNRTPIILRRRHPSQEAQMASQHRVRKNARGLWLLAHGRRMEMQ